MSCFRHFDFKIKTLSLIDIAINRHARYSLQSFVDQASQEIQHTLGKYTLGKYTLGKYTLGKYTLGKYFAPPHYCAQLSIPTGGAQTPPSDGLGTCQCLAPTADC